MSRTFFYNNKPIVIATSSICGPKESKGAIADYVEYKLQSDTFGEKTFEKAEIKMLNTVITNCINNAGLKNGDVDAVLAGDLLDQIICSTFAVRGLNCGYLGVYTACASFVESLILGGALIDGKYMNRVVCGTSSHFSTAERQYRYSLELGCTRPPQSQWTVTGGGACLLCLDGFGPKLSCGTVGKIVDFGVTDTNNMGAAMAPSACDTIYTHFQDTNRSPEYYDLIITGDLGMLGTRLLKHLLLEKGIDISKQHVDCGEMVYNICEKEYQGGSGAGCSSLVFCSYIYNLMCQNKIKKVLLVATGALLSSLSCQQGESIPGVSHAVALEI